MKQKFKIPQIQAIIACLLLCTVIFCGACNSRTHKPAIVSKCYETITNNPMPKELCRYFYRTSTSSFASCTEFTDSCGKYNIGDTIVGSSKK